MRRRLWLSLVVAIHVVPLASMLAVEDSDRECMSDAALKKILENKIWLYDATGELVTIRKENAAKALELGLRDLSPDDYSREWFSAMFACDRWTQRTVIFAALKVVSAGLSDRILSNAGAYTIDEINEARRANPSAKTGGYAAGIIIVLFWLGLAWVRWVRSEKN